MLYSFFYMLNGMIMNRKKAKDFKDLEAWKKAHHIVLEVYKLTRDYPPEERYGLVSQMRRAAVSVPSNIAEGFGRRGKKDKVHFYNMAHSSLEELRYQLILSKDLCFLPDISSLYKETEGASMMLTNLIKSIEKS